MMKRQGDLLILKVDRIPDQIPVKSDRVLAEGEVTGHFHELDLGEVYEIGDTMFFRVPGDKVATLNHPEHGPATFEPGEYQVIRQREYEPKAIPRRVED
jgi:hypothetical protein